MDKHIKPVIRMDFTKISIEFTEVRARIKRGGRNIGFTFSKYYNMFFGYRHKSHLVDHMTLKPITVSLVKQPVVKLKNLLR